ncbi:MAG: protein kinase [Proteobacteria bacterium]|nr:protein kinase [Pseudomonadota bacterium]
MRSLPRKEGAGGHGVPRDFMEADTAGPIPIFPLESGSNSGSYVVEDVEHFDPENEHTVVDLDLPLAAELPMRETSFAPAPMGKSSGASDVDELTLEELRSLVVSVESPVGLRRDARDDPASPVNDDDMKTSPTRGPSALPLPAPTAPSSRIATEPDAEAQASRISTDPSAPPIHTEAPARRASPASSGELLRAGVDFQGPSTRQDAVPSETMYDVSSGDIITDPLMPARVSVVGGRYRIIERVGVGGMGKVFKVTHTRLGKTFALKIISGGLAREKKARELFYREARLASSLSHPNVTSVVDFGEDDAVGNFMVMEFVRGELLADRLERESRIQVRQASEIIKQVAAALDYIHNKGIVHCDIKTENIMLTEVEGGAHKRNKLQVKLLDFGLARSTSGLHNTGSLSGTPHYVAPERLRGEQVAPSNDIYGLGILFYELITGTVPWDGTVDEILNGHLDRDPTPPSQLVDGLEPAVEALVLRTLAKDPARRHRNIAAFLFELQTVIDTLGYGRRKRGGRRVAAEAKTRWTTSERDKTARSLFDASRIPMALISRDGVIVVANPAFARFIMGVAVDVEGLQVQTTTLVEAWNSFETDLIQACRGKSVRRTIKVETEASKDRWLVMWLDPGLTEDQAIFGVHPLNG